jgi:drug/metabolite transporter, DME family
MASITFSRLLVLAAALLFSTGGAAIKATSLNSWQVAGFRSAVAAAALVAFVPAARRGLKRRALPVGIAYASTLILFVAATKQTTAANAIFLQSTAPLYLILLGPLFLREPVRRTDLLFMTGVGIGMSLFFLGSEQAVATAPDPVTGNQIAALSGLAWALTVGGLRWIEKGGGAGDSMGTVVIGNLLAFAVCAPAAFPLESATWHDAAVVAYLGVVQVGLAYVCLTRAVRHVPAFEASTLLLSEPALNPVWAWLVHGERPSRWGLAGGALILTATFANAWWKGRTRVPRKKSGSLCSPPQ